MKKPRVKFLIRRAVNNEFFVRIVLRNGRQTFTSGETLKSKQSARKAIAGLVDALHGLDFEIEDASKGGEK